MTARANSGEGEKAVAEKIIDGTYSMTTKLIGKGKFGKVFMGKHLVTGADLAIKVTKADTCDLSEIKELKKLTNAENVVQLLGEYQKKDSSGRLTHYVLVLEYCNGGDFSNKQLLSKLKGNEVLCRRYFGQLLNGLKAINEKKLLHRDLKPANLLLHGELETNGVLKIADLGFAKTVGDGGLAVSHVGTPLFESPERLTESEYGFPAEMWAAGCILFHWLSGRSAFGNVQTAYQLTRMVQTEGWKVDFGALDASAEFKDLICRLIVVDPAARLTVSQAQQHAWVTDVNREREIEANPNVVAALAALESEETNERAAGEEAVKICFLDLMNVAQSSLVEAASAATERRTKEQRVPKPTTTVVVAKPPSPWKKFSKKIPVKIDTREEAFLGKGNWGCVYRARRYVNLNTESARSVTIGARHDSDGSPLLRDHQAGEVDEEEGVIWFEHLAVKCAKFGAGRGAATYVDAMLELAALYKLKRDEPGGPQPVTTAPTAGGGGDPSSPTTIIYSSTNRRKTNPQSSAAAKQPMGQENVVGMYWCAEVGTPENGKMYMVLEYCDGKDFLHHIQSGALRGNEVRVRRFFSHFLKGLGFMLAQGVQHRDLKPPNLLLSGDLDTGTLKIGDFGLSKVRDDIAESQLHLQLSRGAEILQSECGSKRYWAPERARGEQYGPSAEIFAAGLILYEMLTGDRFVTFFREARGWRGQLERELTKQLSFKEPGLVSPEATDLLRLLLAHDPKDRPSWRAALAHEWFDPIRSEIDPDDELPPRKQPQPLVAGDQPQETTPPNKSIAATAGGSATRTPSPAPESSSIRQGYTVFSAAQSLAVMVAEDYYQDTAADPKATALLLAWLCQVVEAGFFGLSPRDECAAAAQAWRCQAKAELDKPTETTTGTRLAPWGLVLAYAQHLYQLALPSLNAALTELATEERQRTQQQKVSSPTTEGGDEEEGVVQTEHQVFGLLLRERIEQIYLILKLLVTCCEALIRRHRESGEVVENNVMLGAPTTQQFLEIYKFFAATKKLKDRHC